MKNLNEKLASVIFDCHPKDELMAKQAKLVQEAGAGDLYLFDYQSFLTLLYHFHSFSDDSIG